jgi:hypothetical protein
MGIEPNQKGSLASKRAVGATRRMPPDAIRQGDEEAMNAEALATRGKIKIASSYK